MAESEAGDVKASSSVTVRVDEIPGWIIGSWSLSDHGKTAVRAQEIAYDFHIMFKDLTSETPGLGSYTSSAATHLGGRSLAWFVTKP